MKILFVMRNMLYLRNYASTLALLSERGVDVVLAYESDRRLVPAEIEQAKQELLAAHPSLRLVRAAEQDSRWRAFAQQVRGLLDHLRYAEPELASARKSAGRAEQFVYPPLRRAAQLGRRGRNIVRRILRLLEDAIPVPRSVADFVDAEKPDCIVVTPLVDYGPNQIEYLKVARRRGIPSALCVASWDNLTNKGLIQLCPDRVLVWNAFQREEAEALHGVPGERVRITGAQLFDHWFERGPSRDRESFCRHVGLGAERAYVLYTCSSIFISRHEAEFLDRWLSALWSQSDPRLSELSVLVRPHPASSKFTSQIAGLLERYPSRLAVYPAEGGYPVTAAAQDDYFDSLCHCAAVVGINTSAMLEAGIVGRRCLTIRDPELASSQEGMVHFAHLLRDGFLWTAEDFDTHFAQLSRAVATGDASEALAPFIADFLRPNGLDAPATDIVADEIQELAELAVAREPARPGAVLLRPVAFLVALYFQSLEGMRSRKRWADMSLREHRLRQAVTFLRETDKTYLRRARRDVGNWVQRRYKQTRKWWRREVWKPGRSILGRLARKAGIR